MSMLASCLLMHVHAGMPYRFIAQAYFMTSTFALQRVDHLLLVLQCCCVALVYVNLLCRYTDI